MRAVKRLKKARRGLGATDTEHADRAASLFEGAEGELQQAQTLAEHGLCQRAFSKFTLGAEFLAQAHEHEALTRRAPSSHGHAVLQLRQQVQGSIATRCVRGR